jgi:predicted transposase YbfD/YdcC
MEPEVCSILRMQPPSVWTHFESLRDPRVDRTRRHKLMDIVIISVMAVVSFADGWDDIVEYAKVRESWLRTFLELPNYVLALKDNQPTMHQEVEQFFESARADAFCDTRSDQAESVDGDHGRIEVRRVFASDDIGWMADKSDWKGLQSVVMVESERTVGSNTSTERRYSLTSRAAHAAVLAECVRGHWGIENKLHWVLDMAFDEDRSRIRRGNAPDNFALLRKIALNLLKLEKTCKRGLEAKRKRAAWDQGYLLRVLQATVTSQPA